MLGNNPDKTRVLFSERLSSKHGYWGLPSNGIYLAHYVASNVSFLISFAVTVSSFGGPGLSSEQVLKYLVGNLAGLSKDLKRVRAFNYLSHAS